MAHTEDAMDVIRIERDVWRAKFLAMGVKADEESVRAERCLAIAISSQKLLSQVASLPSSTVSFSLSVFLIFLHLFEDEQKISPLFPSILSSLVLHVMRRSVQEMPSTVISQSTAVPSVQGGRYICCEENPDQLFI